MSTDRYPFREVEAKWQRIWEERKQFQVTEDPARPKFYCLEMFPYPSGRIHMGHVRVYAIGDLLARYNWIRELATCDPSYYKWEQLIFIKMFERGLAYRRRSTVNWCPSCQTILANEQVEDGRCWRCDSEVTPR